MRLTTTLLGRVGKDAEVKEVGERDVMNFSVAHTEKWKGKDGQEQERTTWVNCSRWFKRGSAKVANYIKKGNLIFVEGEPSARGYTNAAGEVVGSLELRITELKLISNGKENSTQKEANQGDNGKGEEYLPF